VLWKDITGADSSREPVNLAPVETKREGWTYFASLTMGVYPPVLVRGSHGMQDETRPRRWARHWCQAEDALARVCLAWHKTDVTARAAVPWQPAVAGTRHPLHLFFLDLCSNNEGYYLSHMLEWARSCNWERMEANHSYIQWLLPNKRPSGPNPDAPVLDDAAITAISEDRTAVARLKEGIKGFLLFLKIQWRDPERIVWANGDAERKYAWCAPNDHNHARITRLLTCLCLFGFTRVQERLVCFLLDEYTEHLSNVSVDAYRHWWQTLSADSVTKVLRLLERNAAALAWLTVVTEKTVAKAGTRAAAASPPSAALGASAPPSAEAADTAGTGAAAAASPPSAAPGASVTGALWPPVEQEMKRAKEAGVDERHIQTLLQSHTAFDELWDMAGVFIKQAKANLRKGKSLADADADYRAAVTEAHYKAGHENIFRSARYVLKNQKRLRKCLPPLLPDEARVQAREAADDVRAALYHEFCWDTKAEETQIDIVRDLLNGSADNAEKLIAQATAYVANIVTQLKPGGDAEKAHAHFWTWFAHTEKPDVELYFDMFYWIEHNQERIRQAVLLPGRNVGIRVTRTAEEASEIAAAWEPDRKATEARMAAAPPALYFPEAQGQYAEFTNLFQPAAFVLDGERWPTSEHYYHAQKFVDHPERMRQVREIAKAKDVAGFAGQHTAEWPKVRSRLLYVGRAARAHVVCGGARRIGRCAGWLPCDRLCGGSLRATRTCRRCCLRPKDACLCGARPRTRSGATARMAGA